MKISDKTHKIEIVARTHVGMMRVNNEDFHGYSANICNREWRFYDRSEIEPEYQPIVLALADGMGGLEMGEEASKIAVETTRDFVFEYADALIEHMNDPGDLFNMLFRKINDDILAFAEGQGKAGDIGTTLVIALLFQERLHVYWIGDSRCYLFREGSLTPVSKDHSYVQELVDQGKITYEQAFFHPQSNIITKYMGDPKNNPVPSHTILNMLDGDLLLMCSDGLSGMLQDSEIEAHLRNGNNLDITCQALIDDANQAGGNDNNTVMLLSYGSRAASIPAAEIGEPRQTIRNPITVEPSAVQDPEASASKRKNSFAWVFFLIGGVIAILLFWGFLQSHDWFSKPRHRQEIIEPDTAINHPSG